MKIRVTEIFTSIQGEGIWMGHPSVFVRLFGCNFTCKGFNNPDLTAIDYSVPDGVTKVSELDGDAFSRGCDTPYAWSPEFKHLQTDYNVADLVKEIADTAFRNKVSHVVFTGGEPLLNQLGLQQVIRLLAAQIGIRSVTFETNGSRILTPDFVGALVAFLQRPANKVLFSNSPKLSISGETKGQRIMPAAILGQAMVRSKFPDQVFQSCKYVVGDNDDDFLEAMAVHREIYPSTRVVPWETRTEFIPALAMPMGADFAQYKARSAGVAERCIRFGFRYCPRTHIDLYGNAVGT